MSDHHPPRTPTRRNPLARMLADHYAHGRVTEVESVTPTMLRVRIHSPAVASWRYTPGQHVRIQINDPLSLSGILRPAETLRTYTVWDRSVTDQEFELRAHLHDGEGIGAAWFRNVSVGDPVTYWGPQGDFHLRDADFHVFVAEESGACGIAPLLRELPADAGVYGVVESVSAAHDPPLPEPDRLHRAHRGETSAASSGVLLEAVRALRLPSPGRGVAYLVGEARTCQAIRTHLVRERGWDRGAVETKPFWTPGKRGLHH